MHRRALKSRIGGAISLAVFGLGCSSGGTRETPVAQSAATEGSVRLQLLLADGTNVDAFTYTITGPNGFSKTGPIDTRHSTEPAAIVGQLPEGGGYTIVLTANDQDGGLTTCTGSAAFSVTANHTSDARINVICSRPPTQGSVGVNGSVNVCPHVTSLLINPSRQALGGTIDMTATATDLDNGPSPLSFTWTASQGSLADANTGHATYTCTKTGSATITLIISDGDLSANCGFLSAFRVDCTCATAADCPVASACRISTCNAGICGVAYQPAGTDAATQTAGDCHRNQCDGAGNIVTVVDDKDVPVDGDGCTEDTCSNGLPTHAVLPIETPCAPNRVCDGTSGPSACQPVKFWVLRDGDGAWQLSSDSYPVFIDEYEVDGTHSRTIPLPTQDAGSPGGNQAFTHALTLSGTEGSDGQLWRSVDAHYVSMAGYAAPPDTPGVVSSSSSSIKRVVARIEPSGTVDTTTVLQTAFDGSDVRSAVSVDGTGFWVGGDSNWNPRRPGGDTGGIWYIPFGTTGGTQLLAPADSGVLPNIRWLGIYGSQLTLFGDSDQGPGLYVFSVGSGLPTAPAQQLTTLPGLPTTKSMSPYGFAFMDRIPSVPGLDTLYLADDGSGAYDHGGIQKWVYDGSTWTHVTTFNKVGNLIFSFRGLIALPGLNNTVNLIGTVATTATANSIVAFVDDGSSDILGDAGAFSNVQGQVVATAPGTTSTPRSEFDTVFRGIALPPHN